MTSVTLATSTGSLPSDGDPQSLESRLMSPEPRGPQQVIYEDRYQKLYRVTAEVGGSTKEYVVRDSGHRAGLVVVQQGAILLVRQYRLLIDSLSWEIPGGGVQGDESPEEAAARECTEETGIVCRNLKPLLSYHAGLDTLCNPTHLFYAEDFVASQGKHSDPHEVVQHEWVPLESCVEMIFEGAIADSFSIVALLSYKTLGGGL